MIHSAMERGKWFFFQNCHLAPSWLPFVEKLIDNIDPDKVGSPRRTHTHKADDIQHQSKVWTHLLIQVFVFILFFPFSTL
jgi:hypothetical protein